MKWPFKRKQNVDSVPQEIQEYYQTERRERTGVAWLLALGTLVITVVLAIALFFGGRWAYRKIANNDNQKSPETSQVSQAPATESGEDNSNENREGEDEGQTEGATTNDSQTSSTSTNQPNSSTQNSGRAQGATTGNLPNTGPSETLAVIAATVVVASAAHYAFSKEQ